MRRRQISKRTVSRYRLNRDYSKPFEQALRRTLSKDERAVIYPLERARQTGIPGRFIILDTHDFDARPILIEYFNWIDGGENSIIVALPKFSAAPRGIRRFSWRRPNDIRSHTYSKVLILDTHTQKSPKVSELLQAVGGGVNTTPDTLVVIHATLGIKARIPPAYTQPDQPPDLGVIALEATTDHVTVLSFSLDNLQTLPTLETLKKTLYSLSRRQQR